VEDVRVLVAIVGLSGILAGAVLTTLTSFATGYLSRRHEHRRWLLDRRLEIYVDFNRAVSNWQKSRSRADEPGMLDVKETTRETLDALTRLHLVAPRAVSEKATAVLSQMLTAMEFTSDWKINEAGAATSQVHVVSAELLALQQSDVQSRQERRRARAVPA